MSVNPLSDMERQTPFYSEHIKLGAKMVPFSGWSMPLHYGSQLKEHDAVREHAGIFDVSHMAIADVKGSGATEYLRKVLANDVAKLGVNRALYGCLLNEKAGIIDDLITYKLAEDHYRVVVNAATTTKDIRWLEDKSRGFDVSIELMSDFGLIAVQGPKAIALVSQCLGGDAATLVGALKPFSCGHFGPLMFARTGYTGEDGLEIAGVADILVDLWQKLIEVGVQPVGLGARDSLRLEAGLNLYGSDMDEGTLPDESNLAWTVDIKDEARDFYGKQALLAARKEGIAFKMVGLVLDDKGVIRQGMKVIVPSGGEGIVTSGGFSPTLKKSIALARVPNEDFDTVEIEMRSKRYGARCVKPPFVRQGKVCI